MITFFRKIRFDLMGKNPPDGRAGKTGTYLKYAIGEVVLVVIGILIALQINNWNEESKDKLIERNYLISLKKEMEFNIQIALDQILFNDFQIKNGKLVLACLDDNFHPNSMELAIAIEHIGWNNTINYTRDVWGELYSTGNIGIIRNNVIKSKLTSLYKDMSQIIEFQEQEYSKYNFGYRRLVGDVLSHSIRLNIFENLEPTEYTGELITIPNQDRIIEKLKDLEGLNGYLVDIISTRVTSNNFMVDEIEQMKNIVVLIDEELK